MTRLTLTLALILCASPALADPALHVWGGGMSTIELRPSQAPGAVAEVEFANEPVHTDAEQSLTLSLGGFSVQADMILGRGLTPDRMTITPPEGYIAVPQWVDVPEGASRVITIYSAEGVGM